jgi:hypothetical protein
MKTNLQTLVETVREQSQELKPGSGFSRGTLFKLGFEYWEKNEGRSPSKEEKETIREAIQADLNKSGFRQDYEAVISDKPFKRLTASGEIVNGRNVKMVDTRIQSIKRQLKDVWDIMAKHQDKRAKEPLYDGSDNERKRTAQIKNAIFARLYQLDKSDELRVRVEKQMDVWFPADKGQSVQDGVAAIA